MNIANGIKLDFNESFLDLVVPNTVIADKIRPYLGIYGETAKCASTIYPLELTSPESTEILDGYLTELESTVITSYDSCRVSGTKAWS